MYANYHTHSPLCNHATGSAKEYVESAISAGFKILGFSDHVPQPFKGGYYSSFRMKLEETEKYVDEVNRCKEEYKNDIKIFTGFEAEYYPALFGDLIDFLNNFDYDYLIQGQHFPGNEINEPYAAAPYSDPELLKRYYAQVLEGFSTGKFTYIAHPDLIKFTGDEAIYKEVISDFCRKANAMGAVFELNQLGYADHRHYPNMRFWDIVAEVGGATAIIGCDAHEPSALFDKASQEALREVALSRNIKLLDEIEIVSPKKS